VATRGTQKRIAEETGKHPSTISRGVKSGKVDKDKVAQISNDLKHEKFIKETLKKS
jgi:IS30 family transposase